MKSVLAFVSVASAFCHYGTPLMPRGSLAKRAEGEFGYNELQGPLDWHALDDANIKCATGKNQSPVNIDAANFDSVSGADYNFDIESYPDGAEIENTGHNVQVYVNGTYTVDGKDYEVAQYHFHTPSEHRIGSEYYPMEVHFVAVAEGTFPTDRISSNADELDESTAVVGFMIELAGASDTVTEILTASLSNVDEIPSAEDTDITAALDFSNLASHISNSNVFSYSGSLTTPPCSEEIAFNVVQNPIYVNVATFRAVKSVVKFNSRYTQNAPGQTNLLDNARNVLNGM